MLGLVSSRGCLTALLVVKLMSTRITTGTTRPRRRWRRVARAGRGASLPESHFSVSVSIVPAAASGSCALGSGLDGGVNMSDETDENERAKKSVKRLKRRAGWCSGSERGLIQNPCFTVQNTELMHRVLIRVFPVSSPGSKIKLSGGKP